ncbi:MAG: carbamate kinase [Planctomycetota bacterium]
MQRVLIAIGGNSILPDPARATLADELRAIRTTCEGLAGVVAAGWQLALTHGNGPQVGFDLRRAELGRGVGPELTLDTIDAGTQGSLGYLIQQALGNALRARGLDDRVVSVVTQVLVDPEDPALRFPQKPVGAFYSEAEARARITELGWNMVLERGRGWRRVVPSPRPTRVLEAWAVEGLLASGAVVVACGGGGIPVVERDGDMVGVPGVVDKDRASALLAGVVGARVVVFSTGVSELRLDYGTPEERPLARVSAAEAQVYLDQGQFPPGSMGPKIEAALDFLRLGGERAMITSPECIEAALRGDAGTAITP